MDKQESDAIQNLQESLDHWAGSSKKEAEIRFTEGLFIGSLGSSVIIDKFSMWLLAGTGAIAGLMISNIDKVTKSALSVESAKISIYLLAISSLFAFWAKYKSLLCHISMQSHDEITARIKPVLEEYYSTEDKILDMAKKQNLVVQTELNLDYAMAQYRMAFPKILHKRLEKIFENSKSDRLYSSRKAATDLYWQGVLTALQFIGFLVFMLYSGANINGI